MRKQEKRKKKERKVREEKEGEGVSKETRIQDIKERVKRTRRGTKQKQHEEERREIKRGEWRGKEEEAKKRKGRRKRGGGRGQGDTVTLAVLIGLENCLFRERKNRPLLPSHTPLSPSLHPSLLLELEGGKKWRE